MTLDLLEQVLPACGDVVLNRVEFASLLQYIVTAWVATHSQLLPAAVELLKTEETALETLLPLLRVLRTLCGSFFTVLPGVESVLGGDHQLREEAGQEETGRGGGRGGGGVRAGAGAGARAGGVLHDALHGGGRGRGV